MARGADAGPFRITDTMAFMFESCLIPRICSWALESPYRDHDYYQCWIGLRSHFSLEEKGTVNRGGAVSSENKSVHIVAEIQDEGSAPVPVMPLAM